jgi:hypothetical protein
MRRSRSSFRIVIRRRRKNYNASAALQRGVPLVPAGLSFLKSMSDKFPAYTRKQTSNEMR